jgi:hypothetical protein
MTGAMHAMASAMVWVSGVDWAACAWRHALDNWADHFLFGPLTFSPIKLIIFLVPAASVFL